MVSNIPKRAYNNKITEKQELFCQEYIRYMGNARMAYESAYSAENMKIGSIYNESGKLIKNPLITVRLEAIRAENGLNITINREFITTSLLTIMHKAVHSDKPELARKTANDIARLHGLIIEKQDVNMNNNFTVMKDVTLEGDKLIFDVGSRLAGSGQKVIDVSSESINHGADDLM